MTDDDLQEGLATLRRQIREQENEPEPGLRPNRASALRGPSMKTRFGQDIDPDALEAGAGRALDSAMDRYEVFHDKEPHRAVRLKEDLPTKLVCMGDMLSVMYRTDKWKEDGNDEDYKHVDDPGVKLYEPAKYGAKGRIVGPPVNYPKALTLLGYCLGFFVRQHDGEVYECNPRGCYLFCSPSGNMLAVYSPEAQPDGSKGFLCVMAGGRLRVEKDGIDG